MSRIVRFVLAVLAVVYGAARRRRREPPAPPEAIVAAGTPDPSAENLVVGLLLASALAAIAFVAVYVVHGLGNRTQLLGIALASCLALLAAALIVFARRLVVTEEIEEDYPPIDHPEDQATVARMVTDSGSHLTRKGLLVAAGGAAGGALGLAALTPAISLGPWAHTAALYDTPWHAGRRLVDETGRPLRAVDIEGDTFYTAYPEDARHDLIGAPLVVVRLDPRTLALPAGRAGWAPDGILAYSKICTHAGCAIALYRTPSFDPTEPAPALVCPCHYSTFDPADGGQVTFGPAGRPLPQLPLRIDAAGDLRAAGGFSDAVGPSWSGVRERRST
jgi:ubiquinol-cytochrome c reductase iron-sulfur subunit